MQNLYGVLYDNGIFKVGRSGDVISRLRTHITNGRAMGTKMVCCLITQPVRNPEEAENQLKASAASILQSNTPEYFQGADLKSAIRVMISTGLLVTWTDGVFINKKYSSPLISCPLGMSLDACEPYSDDAVLAVKKILLKHSPINLGVLVQRLSRKGMDRAFAKSLVKDMANNKELIEITSTHPRNKMTVYSYELPKEVG